MLVKLRDLWYERWEGIKGVDTPSHVETAGPKAKDIVGLENGSSDR